MSEQVTGLKIRFGADSKPFKNGVEDANKALNKLKQEGGSSFAGLANIIDNQTGGMLGNFSQLAGGLGTMGGAFKAAGASSGVLSKAMNLLKVAIVSTGIGALIVALGSLVAYFMKTSEGANKFKEITAGIGAVVSVFVDRLAKMGAGLVSFFGGVGSLLKSVFTGDFKKAGEIATDLINQFKNISLADTFGGMIEEATKEAADAVAIQKKFNELEKREQEVAIANAQKRAKIAELKLKAEKEEEYTAEQRLQFLKEAQALQSQINNDSINIEARRVSLTKQRQSLDAQTLEDNKELAEVLQKLNDTKKEASDADEELLGRYKALNKEIETQTENFKALRDATNAVPMAKSIDVYSMGAPLALPEIKYPAVDTSELDAAEARFLAFQQANQQISAAISDSLGGMVESFAETTGALLAGSGDFETFTSILINTLADLAIKVGKIAVGVGVAMLGIETAFASMNPVAAIAAGAALIALGTAVKSAFVSLSKGGGAGAGGYSGGGAMSSTAAPQVEITGEFKIQGRDIALVLSRENNRYNGTT